MNEKEFAVLMVVSSLVFGAAWFVSQVVYSHATVSNQSSIYTRTIICSPANMTYVSFVLVDNRKGYIVQTQLNDPATWYFPASVTLLQNGFKEEIHPDIYGIGYASKGLYSVNHDMTVTVSDGNLSSTYTFPVPNPIMNRVGAGTSGMCGNFNLALVTLVFPHDGVSK